MTLHEGVELYKSYTRDELEEFDLVPSDDLDDTEFEYSSPFPTGESVPCTACQGQCVHIKPHSQFMYSNDEEKEVLKFVCSPCYACGSTGETEFFCEECGCRSQFKLKDGSEVPAHMQWCMTGDLCMTMVREGSKPCGRPIVERFDIHADGKLWGFCGVHAKHKQEQETWARRNKVEQEVREWREQEIELAGRTPEQRMERIRKEFGMGEGAYTSYREQFNGNVIVELSLDFLEEFFGVSTKATVLPSQVVDQLDATLPEPF